MTLIKSGTLVAWNNLVERNHAFCSNLLESFDMKNRDIRVDPEGGRKGSDMTPELELSDEDILDAMAEIPGYIDITTEDFRVIYHLAHAQAVNPALNFPVKYSQQHEDFNLAAGRGMPAPFDNGVMRFAWVAPMVTNWMGDNGFLRKLDVQVRAPGLYGDIVTYEGSVTEKDEDKGTVTIDITGTNQSEQVSTKGTAIVELPKK